MNIGLCHINGRFQRLLTGAITAKWRHFDLTGSMMTYQSQQTECVYNHSNAKHEPKFNDRFLISHNGCTQMFVNYQLPQLLIIRTLLSAIRTLFFASAYTIIRTLVFASAEHSFVTFDWLTSWLQYCEQLSTHFQIFQISLYMLEQLVWVDAAWPIRLWMYFRRHLIPFHRHFRLTTSFVIAWRHAIKHGWQCPPGH